MIFTYDGKTGTEAEGIYVTLYFVISVMHWRQVKKGANLDQEWQDRLRFISLNLDTRRNSFDIRFKKWILYLYLNNL